MNNQLGQPASIEEHNHVRRRYGLVTNLTLRRWANRYGMLEHALHKTIVGSYRRQSRTALFAGRICDGSRHLLHSLLSTVWSTRLQADAYVTG